MVDVDGNKIFTHSYSNYAHRLVARMKNAEFLQRMSDSFKALPFYEHLPLVQILVDKDFPLNNFDLDIINGIQRAEEDTKKFDALTPDSLEWTKINAFYNQRRKYGLYMMPALSDSPQNGFMKFTKFFGAMDNAEFWEHMFSVVLQEYSRNQYLEKNPKVLSELDYVSKRMKENKYVLSPFMQRSDLYDADPNTIKEEVIQAAKDYYRVKVDNYINKLVDMGLLTRMPDGSYENAKLNSKIDKSEIQGVITDYYLNSAFMTSQMISLFSGDPIFYKSNNDWQKRNKQIWSPALFLDTQNINEYYGTITIMDALSDTKSDNPKLHKLYESLFGEHPFSDLIMSKLKENNLTDAASFITIGRYREIMQGLNRWTEDHQYIYDAVKANQKLPMNKINKFYSDFWSTFSVIKPFDFQNLDEMIIDDERYVMNNPYQVKRAEIPIIPQLLTDNEKNSEIAKAMVKLEEMESKYNMYFALNFESAVKVGGHNKYTSLNSFINSDGDQIVKLRNDRYGFQVEVPEHFIYTDNNFGTQIMKLIMADNDIDAVFTEKEIPNLSNIFTPEEIAEGITFDKVLNKYQTTIGHILQNNFTKLKGELNNIRATKRLLWTNGLSNKLPSHYFEAIGNPNTDEEPALPLWFMGWGKKNEQIVSSTLKNKVLKLKPPGMSLVNMSAVGSEDLKIKVDDNGSVTYEARLPWWVGGYFGDLMSDDKGNLSIQKFREKLGKERAKEIEDILSALFYRIPTEHKHSMFKIEIVGFTHPLMGGVIQLPAEATTISGFDFDVDKLYGFISSLELVREVKENGKKGKVIDIKRVTYTPEDILTGRASEKQMWNAVLDLMKGMLSHPNVTDQVLEPSSFDDLKDISYRVYLSKKGTKGLLEIDENGNYLIPFKQVKNMIEEEKLDLQLPDVQSEYIMRNNVGKALIGFFANHNTAHAYFQQIDALIIEDQEKNKTLPSFNGVKANYLSGKKTLDNKRYISKILAAFLAAATDNAKDPIASFMNLNLETVDTFAFLLRLGFNPNDVILFMSQPVISDPSIISNIEDVRKYFKKDILPTIAKIRNIRTDMLIVDLNETKSFYESVKRLRDLQAKTSPALYEAELEKHALKYEAFLTSQYYLRMTYEEMHRLANNLGNVSSAIKVENTSNRSTLSDAVVMRDKLDIRIQQAGKYFTGLSSLYRIPLIQSYYRIGLIEALDIFKELFPWGKLLFDTNRKVIRNNKGKDLTSVEMEHIHYSLLTYIASGFEFFDIKKSEESSHKEGEKLANNNSIVVSLHERLKNYIEENPNSEFIPFLRRFVIRKRRLIKRGQDSEFFQTIEFYRNGLNSIDRQMITDMWEAMLGSDKPQEKKLAEDLIYYAYKKTGFTIGPLSFMDYVPTSFYMNLKDSNGNSFVDYMKSKIDEMSAPGSEQADKFQQQYIRNNINKRGKYYKLIPSVIDSDTDYEFEISMDGDKPMMLNIKNPSEKFNTLSGKLNGFFLPTRFVKHKSKGRTYLYEIYNETKNDEGESILMYKIVPTLGFNNHYVEYDINSNLERSYISKLDRVNDALGFEKWAEKNNIHEPKQIEPSQIENIDDQEFADLEQFEPQEETETPTTVTPKFRIPMDFEDGTGGRKMLPQFAGKSTIELIKEGFRTATSRDRSKSYNQQDIQVGDIIEFYANSGKSKGQSVLVRVTKAPYKLSEIDAETWSKLEGWEPSRFEELKNKGYEQFQYELVEVNQKPQPKPSIKKDSVDNLLNSMQLSLFDDTDQNEESEESNINDSALDILAGFQLKSQKDIDTAFNELVDYFATNWENIEANKKAMLLNELGVGNREDLSKLPINENTNKLLTKIKCIKI